MPLSKPGYGTVYVTYPVFDKLLPVSKLVALHTVLMDLGCSEAKSSALGEVPVRREELRKRHGLSKPLDDTFHDKNTRERVTGLQRRLGDCSERSQREVFLIHELLDVTCDWSRANNTIGSLYSEIARLKQEICTLKATIVQLNEERAAWVMKEAAWKVQEEKVKAAVARICSLP